MKLRTTFYLILVFFDLASLYLIIDFFIYGEVNGNDVYPGNYFLFITGILNLYGVSFILLENYFKNN